MITPQINRKNDVQFDCLWELAAFADAFPSQTITLNHPYTDYNMLIIQFRNYKYGNSDTCMQMTAFFPYIYKGYSGVIFSGTAASVRMMRKFILLNDGQSMFWSTGYYNGSWTNNSYIAPIRIYGVKLGLAEEGA